MEGLQNKNLSFVRGIILNPLSDHRCQIEEDGVLVINDQGLIEVMGPYLKYQKFLKATHPSKIFHFKDHLLVPGFFDMHFHWVQDDVRLKPKSDLLSWLNEHTFPTEMKFSNKSFAEKKASVFFKRLLKTGTIGGACFSSVHETALHAAMKHAQGHLLIGHVLMTQESPTKLLQTKAQAKSSVERAIEKFGKKFILTPRFALSTDGETMSATAKLANHHGLFKQSHLSENKLEIKTILDLYGKDPLFKDAQSYTDIYHSTHMLGNNSLMAHAIHLSEGELKLIKKTKTNLIHCPTSNAPLKDQGLGSGLFNLPKVEELKISWALGSDIGAGPHLSMLDVMQSFVRQHRKRGRKEATWTKSLYRSTLKGAQVLKVDHLAGNFRPGKEANIVALNFNCKKTLNSAEVTLAHFFRQNKKREHFDQVPTAVFLKGKILS